MTWNFKGMTGKKYKRNLVVKNKNIIVKDNGGTKLTSYSRTWQAKNFYKMIWKQLISVGVICTRFEWRWCRLLFPFLFWWVVFIEVNLFQYFLVLPMYVLFPSPSSPNLYDDSYFSFRTYSRLLNYWSTNWIAPRGSS